MEVYFQQISIWALLVSTLIPMILGFVWYNPKTPMGATWMRETGMTEEKMKGSNMGLIFGLSLLFSFMLCFFIVANAAVHQLGANSLLLKHPDVASGILATYAGEFRTFPHGMVHGFFLGIGFVLPVMATNGMFERKSWKLIWVNVGYWTICLMLMGGVISAWH